MNQEPVYYDDAGGASGQVVESPYTSITVLEPFAIRERPTRMMRKLVDKGETHAVQEQVKAKLFYAVARNTVALSDFCDSAAAMVPSSEPLCREITRIYALSSSERLGRMF